MNPILRNILAVIAGCFVGGIINWGLIKLGPTIFPMPEGFNPDDIENIKANIHLFSTGNFLMTWLAHALGTLAGAYTTARLSISNQRSLALLIGLFFLIGGIMAVMMIGGPITFIIADLVLAYLPMGYLGFILARK